MISQYLKRQRLINGLITAVLVSVGVGMLGIGTYQISSDITADIPVQTFEMELQKQCVDAIAQAELSASIEKSPMSIKATGYSLANPKMLLSKYSMAIQQCVGFEMESFCMGDGCDDNVKLLFTLKPIESLKQ